MGKYYCEICKLSINYSQNEIKNHNNTQKHKTIENMNKNTTLK